MEKMNICVSANSKYARYLNVMLLSLFENNRDEKIRVFVLQRDFSKEDKKHLSDLSNVYKQEICFLKINEEEFKIFPITAHFSMETYFRFKIPDLVPKDVDRILYIDVDVIVRDSIRELFEIDLEGYYFAACSDIVAEQLVPAKRRLFNRFDDLRYFNAGILMWNLKEIRGNINITDFVKAGNELNYNLPHVDQDLLNYLYYGKTLYLDPYTYNYLVVDQLIHKGSSADKAKILHFCWYNPWQPGPKTEVYREWWKYAAKTPFYVDFLKEELEKSEELILKNYWERTPEANMDTIMYETTELMYEMKGIGAFKRLLERDDRKWIIYGAGHLGKKLYMLLEADCVISNVMAVFDKNQKGNLFRTEIINDISRLKDYKDCVVVVTPAREPEKIVNEISHLVDRSSYVITLMEFMMEASR